MINVHHVDACPSKITVFLGSVNHEANAAVYPCDATDQHIEWYSDDPGIAAVNPETGYISGVSLGTTKIYAQATNGSKARITVEVVPAMIEEIWLESSHRYVGRNQEDILIANFMPEAAAGREILWYCTDPTVLTVTPDGCRVSIKAEKLGNAVITATAVDNFAVTDCCGFNVVEAIDQEEEAENNNDSREKVKISYVTEDDEFGTYTYSKITFMNSNKVWHCINLDIIHYANKSINDYDYTRAVNRLMTNMYTGYYTNGYSKTYHGPIEFSDEEMRLIYAIDPYGLAAYVQRYAANNYSSDGNPDTNYRDDIEAMMDYKDAVFKMLFGINPRYYKRRASDGEWSEISRSAAKNHSPTTYLSESENLFGAHPIWDGTTMLEALSLTFLVFEKVLNIPGLSKLGDVKDLLDFTHKYYNLLFTLGERVIKKDYVNYATGMLDSYLKDQVLDEAGFSNFKSNNYSICWVSDYFAMFEGVADVLETLVAFPASFYEECFRYLAKEPNYNISIRTQQGVSYVQMNNLHAMFVEKKKT